MAAFAAWRPTRHAAFAGQLFFVPLFLTVRHHSLNRARSQSFQASFPPPRRPPPRKRGGKGRPALLTGGRAARMGEPDKDLLGFLADLSHQAFLGGDELAAVATAHVTLSGSSRARLRLFGFYADYGAAILLAGEDAACHVHVVGLDGWKLADARERTAAADAAAPELHAGQVAGAELVRFERLVPAYLTNARGRVGSARHASSAGGGHQRTPAFIHGLAVAAIAHARRNEEEGSGSEKKGAEAAVSGTSFACLAPLPPAPLAAGCVARTAGYRLTRPDPTPVLLPCLFAAACWTRSLLLTLLPPILI